MTENIASDKVKKRKYDFNDISLTKMAAEGYTIPRIARKLGCSEVPLRKYLIECLPKLLPKLAENGTFARQNTWDKRGLNND